MKVFNVEAEKFAPHYSFDLVNLVFSFEFLILSIIFGTLYSAIYFKREYLGIKDNDFKLVLFSTLISIIVASLVNFVPDDSFAHFRVVENLLEFKQYVFNLNYYVEGTATPLWHLILYIFGFLNFDVPIIARLISFFSSPLIFLLSINILNSLSGSKTSNKDSLSISLVLCLCLSLNPMIFVYLGSGMETIIFLVFSLALISLVLNEKLKIASFLGLLIILTRFDGIIVVLLVSSLVFCKGKIKKNTKNYLLLTFPSIFSFLLIGIFRQYYFKSFFPHVFEMKTINPEKLFAGINYGTTFIYNNFIASIITFVFIFLLLKNFKEYKQLFKNRVFLLFLIAFSLFLSVVAGGGDWMPSSRYFIVPGIILLIISVYLLFNFFEIKNVKILYSLLIIWPLLTFFSPIPHIFQKPYMSYSSPYEFINLLNKDGRYLSSVGNVLSDLIKADGKIYTRWIGYIPHHVGGRINILDELCYFYKWDSDEILTFDKKIKIGHLIEAKPLIKKFVPDIITNIGSDLGPSPFAFKKVSIKEELSYWNDFSGNKKDLQKFLEDNYETAFVNKSNENNEGYEGFYILINRYSAKLIDSQ